MRRSAPPPRSPHLDRLRRELAGPGQLDGWGAEWTSLLAGLGCGLLARHAAAPAWAVALWVLGPFLAGAGLGGGLGADQTSARAPQRWAWLATHALTAVVWQTLYPAAGLTAPVAALCLAAFVGGEALALRSRRRRLAGWGLPAAAAPTLAKLDGPWPEQVEDVVEAALGEWADLRRCLADSLAPAEAAAVRHDASQGLVTILRLALLVGDDVRPGDPAFHALCQASEHLAALAAAAKALAVEADAAAGETLRERMDQLRLWIGGSDELTRELDAGR